MAGLSITETEELTKVYIDIQSNMDLLTKDMPKTMGLFVIGFVLYCFCTGYLYFINNKEILMAVCAMLALLVMLMSLVLLNILLFGYFTLEQFRHIIFVTAEQEELCTQLQEKYSRDKFYQWFYTYYISRLRLLIVVIISITTICMILVPVLVY